MSFSRIADLSRLLLATQQHTCSLLMTNSEVLCTGPVSLRTALARYADLWAPAHKSCFPALAASAGSEEEAARLRHLASPEGKAEFSEWVGAPRRSLMEVLQAFPSVKPSLGRLYTADKHHAPLQARSVNLCLFKWASLAPSRQSAAHKVSHSRRQSIVGLVLGVPFGQATILVISANTTCRASARQCQAASDDRRQQIPMRLKRGCST